MVSTTHVGEGLCALPLSVDCCLNKINVGCGALDAPHKNSPPYKVILANPAIQEYNYSISYSITRK